MKYLLLFMFTFSCAFGQAQTDTGNLLKNAQEYVDSYIAKDYERLATMTHPNIISLSGGMDFVVQDIKADLSIVESMGFRYLDGKIGEIGEVYQSGAELLCFVPQEFTIELKGDKYISTTYLLATSMTKGKVWNFVSLARQDQSSIGTFVPSYLDKMGWPETRNMELID